MPPAPPAGQGESVRRRWVKSRRVLGQACVSFLDEDSLTVSGSIAYHSLLSIFPFLLLLLELSGVLIRHFEMAGRLSEVLQRYLPVRTDFIMENLVGITRAYGRVSLLSFVLFLWSSSGVFVPLEKAMNRAWEVTERRSWWVSRLLAMEMAFIGGCVTLLSAASVGVEIFFRRQLDDWLGPSFHPMVLFLYHLLADLSTLGLALLMFIVIFQRLPNRQMSLRHAFPGALLTALLWAAARWLFTILLPFFNYRHVYGSIGVMVSLMTWAYISSAVVLFGAQVSRGLYRSLKVSESADGKGIPISTLKSLGR